MNWYLKVLKQYAEFNGRARRKEYWMFVLFNILISIGLFIFVGIGAVSGSTTIVSIFYGLYTLYSLAILLPGIAVTVRRLHDINKSGAYFFIVFIPLIGPIWLLVLMATEGTQGENQYGPDPKGGNEIELI